MGKYTMHYMLIAGYALTLQSPGNSTTVASVIAPVLPDVPACLKMCQPLSPGGPRLVFGQIHCALHAHCRVCPHLSMLIYNCQVT